MEDEDELDARELRLLVVDLVDRDKPKPMDIPGTGRAPFLPAIPLPPLDIKYLTETAITIADKILTKSLEDMEKAFFPLVEISAPSDGVESLPHTASQPHTWYEDPVKKALQTTIDWAKFKNSFIGWEKFKNSYYSVKASR